MKSFSFKYDVVTLIEIIESELFLRDKTYDDNKTVRERCWKRGYQYLEEECDELSSQEKKKVGKKINCLTHVVYYCQFNLFIHFYKGNIYLIQVVRSILDLKLFFKLFSLNLKHYFLVQENIFFIYIRYNSHING